MAWVLKCASFWKKRVSWQLKYTVYQLRIAKKKFVKAITINLIAKIDT